VGKRDEEYQAEMQRAMDFRDPSITSKSQWGAVRPGKQGAKPPAEKRMPVQEHTSIFGGTVRKEGRGGWKKKK